MSTLIAATQLGLGRPWWLSALVLLIPIVWLGHRHLAALGPMHKWTAIVLRCLVVGLLILLLARLERVEQSEALTLIAVMDRSESIPASLKAASLDYLDTALRRRPVQDQIALIDVAEAASIAKLPSTDPNLPRRNTTLTGSESRLSEGIQMAMAIAPPDSAVRILLSSEGNETSGDLKEAARTAAINGIPIDVLALQYEYDQEVILRRLAAPAHARTGQSLSLRFVLDSTRQTAGRLVLTLNGEAVDLDPDSSDIGSAVQLRKGTNVKTVTLPITTSGVHEFDAVFVPDDPESDRISINNRASAVTNVAGPGHVRVVDNDGTAGQWLVNALQEQQIDVQYLMAEQFPQTLTGLMDTDAVVLVNAPNAAFTFEQQLLLSRYVTELGGGLLMVGGPDSFGAGGWIGSPVAEVLPVELDPPEKKQMPKGALVLVMDRSGSMTGPKVMMAKAAAIGAVSLLSRRDMTGTVLFDASSEWLVPMTEAGDKQEIIETLRTIGAGGGTVMGPAIQLALEGLQDLDVAVKHIILLSDGQTSDAPLCADLAQALADSEITVSTVGIGANINIELMRYMAQVTHGRFYQVDDPAKIPQIFVKEAREVRRAMIVERTFVPQIDYGLSEILKGLSGSFPPLDGYVLTAPKGGLYQVILRSDQADPILAAGQAGLGRAVAFTASADSRWAASWLGWRQAASFWEQAVRWVGKSDQATDCDILVDVHGHQVEVQVESVDEQGRFVPLSQIDAQVIAPDMTVEGLRLNPIGPGRFRGGFTAMDQGSYLLNLRYRKSGNDRLFQQQSAVSVPFAPEFRDLTDNTPLLTQVAQITGGRMLTADPNQNNLFERAGVKIPEARMPLTEPLLKWWLVLFLLDVAVRRVALNPVGAWHGLMRWTRRERTVEREATLDRLRRQRERLREQLNPKEADRFAAKRYQAQSGKDTPLPKAEVEQDVPRHEKRPAASPAEERAAEPTEAGHIQQLLNAKRKAGQHREDKD